MTDSQNHQRTVIAVPQRQWHFICKKDDEEVRRQLKVDVAETHLSYRGGQGRGRYHEGCLGLRAVCAWFLNQGRRRYHRVTYVTKILPNFRVNFMVRFASKWEEKESIHQFPDWWCMRFSLVFPRTWTFIIVFFCSVTLGSCERPREEGSHSHGFPECCPQVQKLLWKSLSIHVNLWLCGSFFAPEPKSLSPIPLVCCSFVVAD